MTAADGVVLGITKVVDHGPVDRRFNLVFLSEGYQAPQLSDFVNLVTGVVVSLRLKLPFRELWPAMNVFRIDVASTDSGVDVPATATVRNTFFDGRLPGAARVIRCDEAAVHTLCRAQISQYHYPVVIAQVAGDFASAPNGVSIVGSGNPSIADVVIHELGHSAFGLADEYDADTTDTAHFSGPPPAEPNVAKITDLAKVPWHNLVTPGLTRVRNPDCSKPSVNGAASPPDQIGLFEGARHAHCDLYRPAGDCKMRHIATQFCTVCIEQARATLRTFRPVTIERNRFAVNPPSILQLTTLQLDAGPSALVYDPASGSAQLWAIAADASSLTPTFSHTWSTGVTATVPLALNARVGLLIYSALTGRVEIDEVAGDGTRIVTLWPAQWTTDWSAMTSYMCAGSPFLFSYKTISGRAAIDRVADDGTGTITRFDGTIESGFTAFAAMDRVDPVIPGVRPGGALLVGYKPDSGTVVAWAIPDDGSALTEVARLATLPFATQMVPVFARNEMILALNNSVTGDTRWVFAGDFGAPFAPGVPLGGISLAELGSTTWSALWTAIAPFMLGGQNHWLAHRASDGTLVVDRID